MNSNTTDTESSALVQFIHHIAQLASALYATLSKHHLVQTSQRTVADTLANLTTYIAVQTTETLEHLLISLLVYSLVCLAVYWLLLNRKLPPVSVPPPPETTERHRDNATPSRSRSSSTTDAITDAQHRPCSIGGAVVPFASTRAVHMPRCKRILLVTAHPDDESMFFAPTLLALARQRQPACQVYMLCLSSGNYDRLGSTRRDELWRACAVLGVHASNIILVQAGRLPDDPLAQWQSEVVAKLVLHHADALGVDAVCTFDRDGVSGHANHRAIYYACASLLMADLLPVGCRVLTLDSVNVVRKYVGVLDLLVTLALAQHWSVSGLADVARARTAMAEHRSQMVWFRWLYVLFSRYMWMNSWREIRIGDVELEMQIEGLDVTRRRGWGAPTEGDGSEVFADTADELYGADGGQAELQTFVE